MAQVEADLKTNQEMKKRNALICENLQKVVSIITGSLKQLNTLAGVREEARLTYAHY